MVETSDNITADEPPILAESVPVTMPELPLRRVINTEQQFKAISDAMRTKILGIVQHQPATAKQIAERLGATPGAIGHHLHVLEDAGLVQVAARRLMRGIVASYYTRTARIFDYDLPPDVVGPLPVALDFFSKARDEYIEAGSQPDARGMLAFPHMRLSAARAEGYAMRVEALVNDLIAEPPDPGGDIYGLFVAVFRAPSYVQGPNTSQPVDAD